MVEHDDVNSVERDVNGQLVLALGFAAAMAFGSGCASTCGRADSEELVRKGEQCIGVIARGKALQESGRTIHVIVRGQVVRPGSYEMPEGTTLLEAINIAGGFTDYAFTRTVWLVDAGQLRMKLGLQRHNRVGKAPLIWYGKSGSRADFVLQGSAHIRVLQIHVALQC